ncbi:MAG: glycosyl hydrolase family 18 protein [Lachnospiraceae bacterium]
MKKTIVPILVAALLIIVVAIVGIATMVIKKYTPSDEQMDHREYYQITADDEVAVVLQDVNSEQKGKIIDGNMYLTYEQVSTSLNKRFYWDANEGKMLYTTPVDIITMWPDAVEYDVSGETYEAECPIVKQVGEQIYLSLAFVQQYTDMDVTSYENPYRVVIRYKWGTQPVVTAKEEAAVRYRGGIKSEILTLAEKEDPLTVLEELDNWYEVVSSDGFIGYVEKKDVSEVKEMEFVSSGSYTQPEYTSLVRDHKIHLAWHQVTSMAANDTLSETVANSQGINVISPTWFSVTDNAGNISSLVSTDYVALAHQMGMEVWGLVDNFSTEISSYELLSHTAARTNLIANLVNEAVNGGLDGINVDFEQISEETGPHFIQFIRELSISCRRYGLVLSVDNYVPTYTSYYDREEQGIVADYVIIMGYDEHTNGSEEAGSVASLPFVQDGIERTLEEVPAEKLINGIPFYTRLWKISDSGAMDSQVMSMGEASAFITQNQVETFWNKDVSQNYGEYYQDGITYKIWLEDAQSIEAKMQLIQNYDLAGVAEWKLGLEDASVWSVINQYLQ